MINAGSYFDCLDALQTTEKALRYFDASRTSKQAVLHAEWAAMEQFRLVEEERKRREEAEQREALKLQNEEYRRIEAEKELKRQEEARLAREAERHDNWTNGMKMGAWCGGVAGLFFSCAGCLMPHSQLLGRDGGFNRFLATMVLCVGIGAVVGGMISSAHGRSKEI